MNEVTKYPPNTFAWIDLATTDAEGATQFYTELFGWEAEQIPMPEGGHYTMLRQGGKDVAGLGQMSAEEVEQGMPSRWTSLVSVEDVDAVTEHAAGLGGTVLAPAFDVMDQGRMSIVQDPSGGIIGLWEAREHIGAQIVNVPNSLIWNELGTRDTGAAQAFYSELLGWEGHAGDAPGSSDPYITFMNNGRAAAGMMNMAPEWGDAPPHWTIYIAVEDVAKMVERATEMGATVFVPPTDIPGTGTFALLQDPQGAMFNVMRMEQADPMP